MVYTGLFFGMNVGCCQFPFKNLSKWNGLIRQIDATARQK